MTRSKPLGPSFASGKMHQREYGHGHASPDHSVKENGDQNQISRPKVHGTRGGRRKRHDRFRSRFRLVSPVPADSDEKSRTPIQRCSANGIGTIPSRLIHPDSRLGLGLQLIEVGEPVASLYLVIVGEQAVGLRVSRLIAEDLLGPAKPSSGCPCSKSQRRHHTGDPDPRGYQHLIQELLDVFAFVAKPGGVSCSALARAVHPRRVSTRLRW